MKKFSPEIAASLKTYVYAYTDPRNKKIFYIGKGVNDRCFSHLLDTSESEKTSIIKDIRNAGLEPEIDILRHGLTSAEALLVEAVAIDLIGRSFLANKQCGHHSKTFGIIGADELLKAGNAKKIDVHHKAILVTINKLYYKNISAEELYEAARGVWKISKFRALSAEYVMAVYQGVIKEVFKIINWLPAGTLSYKTRNIDAYRGSGRLEFEGFVATDIRHEYIGKSVGASGQNPVQYTNI